MKQYLNDLAHIKEHGVRRDDRTGVGTIGVFGMQSRYDLQEGFPAVTTKKLAWKAMVSELLWFIEGSGDERRLAEILHGTRDSSKTTIWTANAQAPYWQPNAKFEGDLGRVYGVQWRKLRRFKQLSQNEDSLLVGEYEYIDQLANLIKGIKNDPHGRRHILSAWNPADLEQMALPPCHIMAQFYVAPFSDKEINDRYFEYRASLDITERQKIDVGREGRKKTVDDLKALGLPTGKLSCQMYQRSNDFFLGGPFNIASYSLLTHMIAQVCNLEVGEFIHTVGDAHVYLNHLDAVKEQITREPLPAPSLWLNPEIKDIDKFTMDDIKLVDYQSHPAIRAPMAV